MLAMTGSDTPLIGWVRASRSGANVSGARPGRMSVSPRPKRCAISCDTPVAPIFGMDKPPVARTTVSAAK